MSLNSPVLKAGPTDSGAPSGQPTVTSPSFTPSANALLVAVVVLNNDTTSSVPSVQTMTTAGLTWTRQVWKDKDAGSLGGAGTDGGVEIWTAPVGSSPAAMTVAAKTVRSTTGNVEAILTVIEITDSSGSVPTVGNLGASFSASGVPSVTVTTSAGSYLFGAASDWSAGGAGSYATGTTSIADGTRATQISWRIMRTSSTTSAGSTTVGMTAPSGQNYNMVALEVQAAGGGSTSASVTAIPAAGVGDVPAPAPSASSTAAPPTAAATGDVPAPTATATGDATVTAQPADAIGDVPGPTPEADSQVTAPPADATGDVPSPAQAISALVDFTGVGDRTASATGDVPAPAVTGTGDATTTAPPADATGDLPAPAPEADSQVTAPPADATADLPAPSLSAGADIATPTAGATGDLPTPSHVGPIVGRERRGETVTGGTVTTSLTGGTVAASLTGGTVRMKRNGTVINNTQTGGTPTTGITGGDVVLLEA